MLLHLFWKSSAELIRGCFTIHYYKWNSKKLFLKSVQIIPFLTKQKTKNKWISQFWNYSMLVSSRNWPGEFEHCVNTTYWTRKWLSYMTLYSAPCSKVDDTALYNRKIPLYLIRVCANKLGKFFFCCQIIFKNVKKVYDTNQLGTILNLVIILIQMNTVGGVCTSWSEGWWKDYSFHYADF